MGTNFYVEWPGVVRGGKFRPAHSLHIGKSGHTWAGYRSAVRMEDAGLEAPLVSLKQWWMYLRGALDSGAVLHTQYGDVLTLPDLQKWAASCPTDVRGGEYAYMANNGWDTRSAWLDPEGYSFLDREFS